MSKAKTTALSGCLIWFVLISVIGLCVVPMSMIAGMISSFSDFAIETTGGWLCPEDSNPRSYSHPSTSTDEFGNTQPSTAYELHCVNDSGEVVMRDPILYAFVWDGLAGVIGVILTIILAFMFAVPGGMLVTRLIEKLKSRRGGAMDSN